MKVTDPEIILEKLLGIEATQKQLVRTVDKLSTTLIGNGDTKSSLIVQHAHLQESVMNCQTACKDRQMGRRVIGVAMIVCAITSIISVIVAVISQGD